MLLESDTPRCHRKYKDIFATLNYGLSSLAPFQEYRRKLKFQLFIKGARLARSSQPYLSQVFDTGFHKSTQNTWTSPPVSYSLMGVEALMDPDVAVKLLGYLNIYSPIVLYCLFHLTSFASDSCSTRKIESGDWSSVETGSPPSRKKLSRSIFKWLSALMLAIHLNNAVLILSTNLMLTRWWQEKTVMVRLLQMTFLWRMGSSRLMLDIDSHYRLSRLICDHITAFAP